MCSLCDSWLARLRHDLVKRLVWPARDLADIGGVDEARARKDLLAPWNRLVDHEGRLVQALGLWESLRPEAPSHASTVDLDGFSKALEEARREVETAPLERAIAAVLRIHESFVQLARNLEHP